MPGAKRPRIKPEDYLFEEDLEAGMRVRTAVERDGHVLSVDMKHSLCARQIVWPAEQYEHFRAFINKVRGEEWLGEWWMARDTRKDVSCSQCRTIRDKGTDPFIVEVEAAQAENWDCHEPVSLNGLGPKEKVRTMRFLQKVALIKQEFGAVEVA